MDDSILQVSSDNLVPYLGTLSCYLSKPVPSFIKTNGQSYKGSFIVNYGPRVVI